MSITIRGAAEHNLDDVDIEIHDGLTAVTGVSGSGKSSLAFDTLYHEARRRFLDIYALQSSSLRLNPAQVESIDGLLPAVAVAQNLFNRNPGSTVATASGIHPFLRLLFSNFGIRSCPNCGSPISTDAKDSAVDFLLRASSEEPVTVSAPLVRSAKGSHSTLLKLLILQFGADAITVDGKPYRNRTLRADTPHDIELKVTNLERRAKTRDARKAVEKVTDLGASFLKAGSGIQALAPVCFECGAWIRDISPSLFHQSCPYCSGDGCILCDGTGMYPDAAWTRWEDFTLTELLALNISEFVELLDRAEFSGTAKRLRMEMYNRAIAIKNLGLGYLTLDRTSPSLSRGEAQRLRLSVCLASKLELLHILDEPSIGLHPTDIGTLFGALRKLSGPVVYVEHERAAAAAADFCIDVGPGAGEMGGTVVYAGDPAGLWSSDTTTGRFFSLQKRVLQPEKRPAPDSFISIIGAQKNNLRGIDVEIPVSRITSVTGVSGSGKTSLVQGILASYFHEKDSLECDEINTPPLKCVHVDQNPIGINPRSNPATYTKLSDIIRDVFASLTGLSPSAFSFNRSEGACPACKGVGAEELKMRYLPSTWIICPVCEGKRFSEEVLSATADFCGVRLSIADMYERSIEEVAEVFLQKLDEDPSYITVSKRRQATAIIEAMLDIGLGYLPLGQPSPTLSGGEAQRIKLAKFLGKKDLTGQLLILDEPSTGLHPADVNGLLSIFDRLSRQGTTLVVVEHNQDIIRASDWIVDLGPGAGPEGGLVVYQGDINGLLACSESRTGHGLRHEKKVKPRSVGTTKKRPAEKVITIRNAEVNNLKNVTVKIPKEQLTVVTGVSGSGKSSLVEGVLESEARRRYLETLSMYERQSARETGEGNDTRIDGLGVTVAINPARGRYNLRSTVGMSSEITHRLSVLLASSHKRVCLSCGTDMRRGEAWTCPSCGETAPILSSQKFFRNAYSSACVECNGVGTLRKFNPKKLIIRPDLPLCGGAMHSPGFFPKGYLCKPFNGGYDMVQALARKYDFDPARTPWVDISQKAQDAFLYGEDEPLDVVYRSRKGNVTTRVQTFHGFFRWIGDWDIGGTYTDTEHCAECGGSGLRPECLAVKLAGFSIHELSESPLAQLHQIINNYTVPADASRSVHTSYDTALRRAEFLVRAGLGYVNLNRLDATLSAGEAQRVKLAGLLGSGLSRMCILLDEPSRGMHPVELEALLRVVTDLRDEGNTVIVVEHEPMFIEAADTVIDMGPGAGRRGGKIIYNGSVDGLRQGVRGSATSGWLSGANSISLPLQRREPTDWITLKNASENNLRGIDVKIPTGVITGVCGVSGSGKSTLIVDTLGRVLAPIKQTTSVAYEPIEPGANDGVLDPPGRTVIIDQARAGVRTPGVFLDLERHFVKRYAESSGAAERGYEEKVFTRSCTACGGAGRNRLEMGFLPDVFAECEVCGGTGYPAEAREIACNGLTIAELSRKTFEEIHELWGDDPKIGPSLSEAISLGLGYLVFHQPAHTMSGGEAQRLKIVKELVKKRGKNTLYVMDEPTVGQHLADVSRLSETLSRLADAGDSILVVEHHMHLLAACDWLIELGPGAGPDGGTIVAQGPPESVAAGTSPTAPYLRAVLSGKSI